MVYSKIDQFYRSLLLSKFFTKGWGKPDNLKRIFEFRKVLSNRESCQALVEKDYPITIDKDYRDGDCRIMEGHFKSPFVDNMPGIMPREVETASFQAILPIRWQHPTLKPICIHLAGTGDHFFWRRRMFTARPLLKHAGIASILLENPYYGSRKPKSQIRSSLHNVSDLFVMGGALVLESMALLNWCERQGWGPFGISGVSMGGHMASLAATNWERPISLVPLLSWSTASCVFTQGVMSGAIPWQVLQEQFFKNNLYHDEISKLIVSPERAYQLGQQFVIDYSRDLEENVKSQPEQQKHTETKSSSTPSTTAPSSQTAAQQPVSPEGDIDKVSSPSSSTLSSSSPPSSSSSSLSNSKISSKAQNLKSAATSATAATNSNSKLNLSLNQTPDTSGTMFNSQEEYQKVKPSREEGRRLTLDYAQTKQSQQSADPGTAGHKDKTTASSKKLTLNHAIAKSKILFSLNKKDNKEQKATDNGRSSKRRNLQEESYEFMRGVMDECTHLANFSVPVDPELVIIVSAKQDAYIPRDGVLALDKLWPGCEVRYVDQGHIGAVLLHQNVFRKAVTDAFDKQIHKYYPDLEQDMRRIRKTATGSWRRRDS